MQLRWFRRAGACVMSRGFAERLHGKPGLPRIHRNPLSKQAREVAGHVRLQMQRGRTPSYVCRQRGAQFLRALEVRVRTEKKSISREPLRQKSRRRLRLLLK